MQEPSCKCWHTTLQQMNITFAHFIIQSNSGKKCVVTYEVNKIKQTHEILTDPELLG
jgi:hypothetical protein